MTKINKILLATDLSSHSERALDYAIKLARKTDAQIVGAFAWKDSSSLYSPVESMENYLIEARKQAQLKLDQFFADGDKKGVEIETRLCLGPPEQALRELASREKAALILVGKHSCSALERFFIGSNTEKILRDATCPVLVVPDVEEHTVKWDPILCATDFSAVSIKAFELGIELAKQYDAKVSLLHSIELGHPAEFVGGEITEYLRSISNQAEEKLQEMVSGVETPSPVDLCVTFGKASDRILEKVDELGSDLVILGKCGHSLTMHRVLGSTTGAVLRGARFPVLAVPVPNHGLIGSTRGRQTA